MSSFTSGDGKRFGRQIVDRRKFVIGNKLWPNLSRDDLLRVVKS